MRYPISFALILCSLPWALDGAIVQKFDVESTTPEQGGAIFNVKFTVKVLVADALIDYDNAEPSKQFVPSQIMLMRPDGTAQSVMLLPSQHTKHVEGKSVTLERTLSFSAFWQPGVWQIAFVLLTERKGMQQYAYARDLIKGGARASFLVPDRGVDTEAPRLFMLELQKPMSESLQHIVPNEKAVNIHGDTHDVGSLVNFTVDRALTVRLHIVDDLAGLYRIQRDTDEFMLSYIHVESMAAPHKAGQSVYVPITPGPPQLVSGDAMNGVYEVHIPLPDHAWPGEWRIVEMRLSDEAGNTRRLSNVALGMLGWPSSTTVRNFNVTYRMEDPFDYSYFEHWHPSNDDEDT